ncbi:Cyanovirin-N [Saccharata proteae CBS 121410]|uniref:Cyanovirin-N n=1 Tax=Saccharata proteae CBS 121410 TaxID=1314787 RepID=A0A9P4LV71_9PEZI|nr:Cyanovirin-N [Saccharata proteae CBS 121410]
MSFHLSAEDIRIEDGHILKARLRAYDGELRDAEIDLDNHIGNQNGTFHWDGGNFSQSAENVHFAIEGGGQVPVLRANLFNENGEAESRDVNLSERIENHDGRFVYSAYTVPSGARWIETC